MSFTQAGVNDYNFSEVTESDKQVLVTNNLGRTAKYGELVYLDGYFGEVREYGGIANGATGRININADRIIRTQQVEATDTFTKGSTLWFVSGGSSAAGTLEDADPGTGTRYACGIITDEEGTGGAQTAVSFRPFVQRLDSADVSAQVTVNTAAIGTLASLTTTVKTSLVAAINEVVGVIGALASLTTTIKTSIVSAINELVTRTATLEAEPKTFVQKVTTGAASIDVTGLAEGDEIIDVMIIPTGASTNGTIKITDGTSDITNAMACALDKTIARASTIDDAKSTLPAAGAKIVCAGDAVASTVAIVVFTYIPAA